MNEFFITGDTCTDRSECNSSDDTIIDDDNIIAQYFDGGNICDLGGDWYTAETYLNKITPYHGISEENEHTLPVNMNVMMPEMDVLVQNEPLTEMDASIPSGSLIEMNASIENCVSLQIEPLFELDESIPIDSPIDMNVSIENGASFQIEPLLELNTSIPNEPRVQMFPCPILGCSKSLKLKNSINRHVQQFHGELRPDTGTYGIKKFVCVIQSCKRRCESKNNVQQHYQKQHGKKPRNGSMYTIDWDDVEPLKYK